MHLGRGEKCATATGMETDRPGLVVEIVRTNDQAMTRRLAGSLITMGQNFGRNRRRGDVKCRGAQGRR